MEGEPLYILYERRYFLPFCEENLASEKRSNEKTFVGTDSFGVDTLQGDIHKNEQCR